MASAAEIQSMEDRLASLKNTASRARALAAATAQHAQRKIIIGATGYALGKMTARQRATGVAGFSVLELDTPSSIALVGLAAEMFLDDPEAKALASAVGEGALAVAAYNAAQR
jgi:hypothetical protein